MLDDEYQIRRKSLELGIPVLTTLELADSFVKTLESNNSTFNKIHKGIYDFLRDIFPENEEWRIDLSELIEKETCPIFLQGLIKYTSKHINSCQIFALWYAHLRFSHPEIENSQILLGTINIRIRKFKSHLKLISFLIHILS